MTGSDNNVLAKGKAKARVLAHRTKVPRLRQKVERLDIAYMVYNDPPPIPWVIDDLAARDESTLLYGAGGMAKSMLMQVLQDGIVRGKDVAGFKCRKGKAIHFDAENGPLEIHRRVHKLSLSPDLIIYNIVGIDLDEPDDLALIEEIIILEEPDLVTFDSLRRLTPSSEENDSANMSRVLSKVHWLCQEYHFAAIVIHHSDKLGRTFRGSSAIRDQVSMAFKLGRDDKDEDKHRRYVETDKFRLGDEPDKRWFRLTDVHDEGLGGVGRLRVEAVESAEEILIPMLKRSERIDEVKALFGNGFDRGKAADIARELDIDRTDQSLRRALKKLVESNYLVRLEDRTYVQNGDEEDESE